MNISKIEDRTYSYLVLILPQSLTILYERVKFGYHGKTKIGTLIFCTIRADSEFRIRLQLHHLGK